MVQIDRLSSSDAGSIGPVDAGLGQGRVDHVEDGVLLVGLPRFGDAIQAGLGFGGEPSDGIEDGGGGEDEHAAVPREVAAVEVRPGRGFVGLPPRIVRSVRAVELGDRLAQLHVAVPSGGEGRGDSKGHESSRIVFDQIKGQCRQRRTRPAVR